MTAINFLNKTASDYLEQSMALLQRQKNRKQARNNIEKQIGMYSHIREGGWFDADGSMQESPNRKRNDTRALSNLASAFVGDPGPEILDALVAQQAAGRAGRRGMDRQGHLVWVGMTWPRIQSLMRGLLPNIVGKNPRYPAIALQAEVSSYSYAPVSDDQLLAVCQNTLNDFVSDRETGNYVSKSRAWMERLELSLRTNRVDSAGNSAPMPQWRREMIWTLRSFTRESFCLEFLLE